mmetsp:Transcript_41932/g.99480  ORF Transcript_41932/g.99480 Transcript_41932/m.99480 type:complete len:151 (-) Transcript_41932:1639-2091(-)
MVSEEGAPELRSAYIRRVGGPPERTHQLAAVALLLANLSSGAPADAAALRVLRSRAAMDALFTLAGAAPWCYQTQFHAAVAYRAIADAACKAGGEAVRAAAAAGVPEGISVLIRNAEDFGREDEARCLGNIYARLSRHPAHPENQVVARP